MLRQKQKERQKLEQRQKQKKTQKQKQRQKQMQKPKQRQKAKKKEEGAMTGVEEPQFSVNVCLLEIVPPFSIFRVFSQIYFGLKSCILTERMKGRFLKILMANNSLV